jgi:choline dehydrogenase-like flavoprotein
MAQSFDAIVLGAGAMGSAASYYLAKARQRVLCLEPFGIDHRYGSKSDRVEVRTELETYCAGNGKVLRFSEKKTQKATS